MSSSRRRDLRFAAALIVVGGCGRPPAPRETEREPGPSRADAADAANTTSTADAAEIDALPLDAPMPIKPTLSAEDERALDEAVGALDDEHRQGWSPAMKWLIDHPDLARPPLTEIVESGGSPAKMSVKRAATVLGEIGHPDDVPVLAAALARGEEIRSWQFAHALALHRDPAALAALDAATQSDNVHVVQAVAGALGTRQGDGVRPLLERLLDHERSEVRYTTVLSIIKQGAKPSRAALVRRKKIEQDAEVRGALRKAGV
jgi:HEAT repeat protein